jgi:hypothetical protein
MAQDIGFLWKLCVAAEECKQGIVTNGLAAKQEENAQPNSWFGRSTEERPITNSSGILTELVQETMPSGWSKFWPQGPTRELSFSPKQQ